MYRIMAELRGLLKNNDRVSRTRSLIFINFFSKDGRGAKELSGFNSRFHCLRTSRFSIVVNGVEQEVIIEK